MKKPIVPGRCIHHPGKPAHLRNVCKTCYWKFNRMVSKQRTITWQFLELTGEVAPIKSHRERKSA